MATPTPFPAPFPPPELGNSTRQHCADLADPDPVQFGISLFICIGILVSYLPQHASIVAKRTSAGISPYFVLLGTLSVNFALAYILALPASRADMACCATSSSFACFAGVLGVLQIATQFACFWLILLLWLAYFPRDDASGADPPPTSSPRAAVNIATACAVHALALAVLNIVLTTSFADALQGYANVLGLAATAIALVQYLPQIWTTYRLKSVGALSIPMMCIQTPGSYVWAASLAARLGWAGWSIWGLYMITGFLQGIILVLGITYELRARKKRRALDVAVSGTGPAAAEGEEQAEPDERTPLVRDGDGD